MSSPKSHAVILPASDFYLGVFPELENYDILLKCQYCDKNLLPHILKDHMERCPKRLFEEAVSMSIETEQKPIIKTPRYKCESPQVYSENADTVPCKFCGLRVKLSNLNSHFEQMHRFSSTSASSSNSLPTVNSSTLSEVDTSSSNSSPIWESDKNNTYDSLSSSSSNSVNIVRLKHDRPRLIPKDIHVIIPGCSSRSCETTQEPVFSNEKHSLPAQQFRSSVLNHKTPELQAASLALPVTISSSASCSTSETFKCQSFFERIEPTSSFVTTVKESSSEMGKTPKLIIRRVPHQNPNDVRRMALNKGFKENPNTDNLRCFLLTKGQSRPQNIKPSKHQVKKKLSEVNKVKDIPTDERDECLRASEQRISILTGSIELLNSQIEKLTGQIGPLRTENEEYKAEIRNLRSRVEELENSTNALIEQRNLRAKNDQKIEEMKQTWEKEKFCFNKRLEELMTELNGYKNFLKLEKQNANYKSSLQEALSKNFQEEKEILERHLSPEVHYRLATNELVDIQTRRSLLYSVLNRTADCHINAASTLAQPARSSRQMVDVSGQVPLNTSSVEMLQNNGQLINIYNLSESKMQYQGYSEEMTDVNEMLSLKSDGNSSTEGANIS